WPLALGAAAVPGLVALIGLVASHLNPWWLLLLALSPAAVAAEPVLRQSAYRRATWAYRDRLARLDARLTAARSADAARMRRLTPDAVAVLALAGQPRPRQPDGADWLLVRVGWYDVASGLELRLPAGGDRLLRQEAMAALARHQALNAVPALVSLGDAGGLGVTGDRERVAGLCRWLGLQLATLHGAADLRLVAAAAAGDQETWSWLGWLPHAGLPGAPPGGVVAAGEAAGSLVEALLA